MLAKMNRMLLAFAAVASVASAKDPAAISIGSIAQEGLSVDQAKQVLVIVLEHEGYKLKNSGMFLESMAGEDKFKKPFVPGYSSFSLDYADPDAGALENLGLFSVSVFTGDVWEIHSCKRFDFPVLQRLQEHIMKQTGKTRVDEKEQRKGLGCTDEG
ncbi:MAG: hypothetical protein LBE22_08255 [Azoarcus sp.]|jgi:hypothetical protein|nr:hypothetical protein [Azoarcus sp.]